MYRGSGLIVEFALTLPLGVRSPQCYLCPNSFCCQSLPTTIVQSLPPTPWPPAPSAAHSFPSMLTHLIRGHKQMVYGNGVGGGRCWDLTISLLPKTAFLYVSSSLHQVTDKLDLFTSFFALSAPSVDSLLTKLSPLLRVSRGRSQSVSGLGSCLEPLGKKHLPWNPVPCGCRTGACFFGLSLNSSGIHIPPLMPLTPLCHLPSTNCHHLSLILRQLPQGSL